KIISFKKVAIFLIVAGGVLGVNLLLLPSFSDSRVGEFIKNNVYIGPVIIILYTALSHVFAPVISGPFIIVSYKLFGLVETVVYMYIGGLISAAISFYLARKFGRKFVTKMVGEAQMKEVDGFTSDAGVKMLIITRLLGFSLFDIVSYAFGLTLMKFHTFMIITAIFSAIPNAIVIIAFERKDALLSKDFILTAIFLTLIQVLYIRHLHIQWKRKGVLC
ncbi:MAG: VTT domain-containing protein, partial [Patescibacteria group bacterium]|nr:VTT domain-containing protein [Patescibacteria group bacterium]